MDTGRYTCLLAGFLFVRVTTMMLVLGLGITMATVGQKMTEFIFSSELVFSAGAPASIVFL